LASGYSLVQRNPTECVCVSLSVIVKLRQRGLGTLGDVNPRKEINSISRMLIEKLVVVKGVTKFLALYGIQTLLPQGNSPLVDPILN
jgi:hypothetical protein